MAFESMREWISTLEREGELRTITAEVDSHLELGGIMQRVFDEEGPAVLFSNIKNYQNSLCRRVFSGSLGSHRRIAMAMGLPKNTAYPELIKHYREKMKERVAPVRVQTGPVKENVLVGDDVDLRQFPAPFWHKLDGGRYINTFGGVVTKDPESGWVNVGNYRMMVHDKNSTGITVITGQHNWMHFRKWRSLGKPMPAAVVIGWDPVLPFTAASAQPAGVCEYDVMGALRGRPVELVRCETVDLEVPATAEIVLEGEISTDFNDFRLEGPFGEYTGYYTSEANRKPVFRVKAITFRNDPILQGTLEGVPINEDHWCCSVTHGGYLWNALNERMAGVTGVNVDPSTGWANVFVQIDNTYLGQVHQVAANIWSLGISTMVGKNIYVFDKDIDIYDLRKVMWGLAYRVDPARDIIKYPGWISPTDPVVHPAQRSRVAVYRGHRLLVDSTKPVDNPRSDLWMGEKFAPLAYPDDETMRLVSERWGEYGVR